MSNRPTFLPAKSDVLAGLSVALVLIPQALAYAELAGLPGEVGLIAGTLPAIAAAVFVSSPYLQTGPTALTGLLVIGALAPLAATGSAEYIKLAALLAVMVGVFRIILGVARMGIVAYFVSESVLLGFTTGAAILIISSQVPTIVGVSAEGSRVMGRMLAAVGAPDTWSWPSVAIALVAGAATLAGKKIHPLFPSVLFGVGLAWGLSFLVGYDGKQVGELPNAFPSLQVDLPWAQVPTLIVPALIIALIGFAEASSIARTYASIERTSWSANREFVSQGAANLVAGLSGGFPVGGSFGRSSLNRNAGARSGWAGAVTGLALLCVLPVSNVFATIPKPALAGVIVTAVYKLVRFREIFAVSRRALPQALVALATAVATLALDPRIDLAILVGIGLSVLVHLGRELVVGVDVAELDGVLTVSVAGVLWFGSATRAVDKVRSIIDAHPDTRRVEIDLAAVGRIDLNAATELTGLLEELDGRGVEVALVGVPGHAQRVLPTPR